jgi:hypothetical protein
VGLELTAQRGPQPDQRLGAQRHGGPFVLALHQHQQTHEAEVPLLRHAGGLARAHFGAPLLGLEPLQPLERLARETLCGTGLFLLAGQRLGQLALGVGGEQDGRLGSHRTRQRQHHERAAGGHGGDDQAGPRRRQTAPPTGGLGVLGRGAHGHGTREDTRATGVVGG